MTEALGTIAYCVSLLLGAAAGYWAHSVVELMEQDEEPIPRARALALEGRE